MREGKLTRDAQKRKAPSEPTESKGGRNASSFEFSRSRSGEDMEEEEDGPDPLSGGDTKQSLCSSETQTRSVRYKEEVGHKLHCLTVYLNLFKGAVS